MDNQSSDTPTPVQKSSSDKGRAWRIIAVVLTLHAALLGGVVLIQGCSKSDSSHSLADVPPIPTEEEQIMSPRDNLDPSRITIKLPSSDALLPDEQLPGSEMSPTAAPLTPSTESLIAQGEELRIEQPGLLLPSEHLGTEAQINAQSQASSTGSGMERITPKPVVMDPITENMVNPSPAPAPVVANTSSPSKTYSVRQGDSLSRIAKKHGVTVAELTRQNRLNAKSILKIGQKLTIPGKKSSGAPMAASLARSTPSPTVSVPKAAASSSGSKKLHTVRAGESPGSIAKRYGVSVQALMKSNKITDARKMKINQKLVIPSKGVTTSKSVPAPVSHPMPLPVPQTTEVRPMVPAPADEPLGFVREVNGV
jgi:LysM repeat protein